MRRAAQPPWLPVARGLNRTGTPERQSAMSRRGAGQGDRGCAMKLSSAFVATLGFGVSPLVVTACGGESQNGGSSDAGGTSGGGSAGTAANGGTNSAGSAGTDGGGGSSGTAAAAGASGDGGSAGTSGSAGAAGSSGNGGDDPATGCALSGGAVTTAPCCASASDYPNTCAMGACSCGPDSSIDVMFCDCPQNRCFDGSSCVAE